MAQKKRLGKHQRHLMQSTLREAEKAHIHICPQVRKKVRKNVTGSWKSLPETFAMRGVQVSSPMNDLGVELQQCCAVVTQPKRSRGGKKIKKGPKTMKALLPPPSSAYFYPDCPQFYLNQHVQCSQDRLNWWNATITRINPAAHVLELQVWNSPGRGWRFLRPLMNVHYTNDYYRDA